MGFRAHGFFPIFVVAVVAMGAAWLAAEPTAEEKDLAQLGSPDADTRNAAIARLSTGSGAVASRLVDAIDDDGVGPLTRGAIAEVATAIGPGRTHVAALQTYLASSDANVRATAMRILAARPSLAAKDVHRVASNRAERASIRIMALVALAKFGDKESRHLLKEILDEESSSPPVRRACLRALAQHSASGATLTRLFAEEASNDRMDRICAAESLSHDDSRGQGQLIHLVVRPEPFLRELAVRGLGQTAQKKHLKRVAGLMADADARVREAALAATQTLGGGAQYKANFAALLADGDPRVRAAACRAVAREYASNPQAVQVALRARLGDAVFRVRYQAALALAAHGDKFGAATMLADQATPNTTQQKMASLARTQILATSK